MTEATETKKRGPGRPRKSESDEKQQTASAPRVTAGDCPKSESHKDTHVYKTDGKTRYCKCNDCGELWTVRGRYADPLKDFLDGLALSLDSTQRRDVDGQSVIVMPSSAATQLARDCREAIKTML